MADEIFGFIGLGNMGGPMAGDMIRIYPFLRGGGSWPMRIFPARTLPVRG